MKSVVRHPVRFRQRGMTLIEILVASALLLVITVGLTVMFSQTQRAFRTSLRNADVYEGARAVMDLMSRDLEQMSRGPYTNFHAIDNPFMAPVPVLPDGTLGQLHDFCFLTQISNRWVGIGYKLVPTGIGVAELFRFSTNYHSVLETSNLIADFNAATNIGTFQPLRQICSAVVNMRVMPYSTNGYSPYDLNGYTNIDSFPQPGTSVGLNTNFFDFGNCVPAYIHLEMALLEPQNFEQFKGLPVTAQRQYVIDHAHHVHVFRQQIPIRAAQR